MAITKLVSAGTPVPTTGNDDWQKAMAQLTALKTVMAGNQMHITQWTNTTTLSKLAMGSYIQHLGAIYVVDAEDYAIPVPEADGTHYIQLIESGVTLAVSFITDISGFSYDANFNGLYNVAGAQILPYQLSEAGSVYTKRKIINPFGNGTFTLVDYLGKVTTAGLATVGNATVGGALDVTHNVTVGAILAVNNNATVAGTLDVTGAISGASLYATGAISGASLTSSGEISASAISTGFGTNQVYKTSRETIDFGSVTSDTIKSIGTMVSGETKFVNVTGYVADSETQSRYARLQLPAGGTYDVLGVGVVGRIYGLLAGATAIFQTSESSTSDRYLTSSYIIRKL